MAIFFDYILANELLVRGFSLHCADFLFANYNNNMDFK